MAGHVARIALVALATLLAAQTHAAREPERKASTATRAAAAGSAKARTAAGKSKNAVKRLDRSGRKRVGKASFYAPKFAGRRMADGQRMDPKDDNAASKTLPLGTRARVKNRETGQSAVVTIQDRGPYVEGRIVDLSPSTARKIGIEQRDGIAEVEVTPLKIPPATGPDVPLREAQR